MFIARGIHQTQQSPEGRQVRFVSIRGIWIEGFFRIENGKTIYCLDRGLDGLGRGHG